MVADGVEDRATRKLLTSMNRDLVHGWHLARATLTGNLLVWLSARDRAKDRSGL